MGESPLNYFLFLNEKVCARSFITTYTTIIYKKYVLQHILEQSNLWRCPCLSFEKCPPLFGKDFS